MADTFEPDAWRERMARLRGRFEGANDMLAIWTDALELSLDRLVAADTGGLREETIEALTSARDRAAGLLDELTLELSLLKHQKPPQQVLKAKAERD